VGFARFYNRRHDLRGYFWGDRLKSVIVENGVTLINCLAYIDLNPLRAGLRKATSKSLKIRLWKRSAAETLNSAEATVSDIVRAISRIRASSDQSSLCLQITGGLRIYSLQSTKRSRNRSRAWKGCIR
jgi:hypothetical protein